MNKPVLTLSLLMLSASAVFAQTSRSKNVNLPVPSYAEVPAPANLNTYTAMVITSENSVLPYTEDEFFKGLQLQSFTQLSNPDADADLAFAMKGISPEDLDIDISRNKLAKEYNLSIVPGPDAQLKILVMVNGTATQLHTIPVRAKRTTEGKTISESLNFSFEEEEKYLVFYGDDKASATPYLVEQYLSQLLGHDFLSKTIVPTLYEIYDNRVDYDVRQVFYIKDKKNEALEAETEAKTLAFDETIASFKTLEELRAGSAQLNAYADYWKSKLAEQDVSDKAGRKVSWGMYMNLHTVAFLQEDYATASDYLNKALEMDEKKGITKAAMRNLKDLQEGYALNFDPATGNQLYAENYEKDPLLEKIEAIDMMKSNNIKDAPGYVLQEDGTKLDGKVSLTFFATPGAGSGGNMLSLDGDDTGRRVYVKHLNKKGKTRISSFKCKEVKEIVVDGAVYEAVNPKVGILKVSNNALSGLNLNNTIFMKRVFVSEEIGLHKDLMDTDSYYFSIPGVKKAEVANADFFAGCPALADRIAAEEFSNSEEDQIKIAQIYTQNCGAGTSYEIIFQH